MIRVLGMVLAGGRGTRLGVISWKRAKPAVPFGGNYRIIDFTLSNLMYSGVRYVGVMTQYLQTSLMEHLGDGAAWGWHARQSRLKVLHPVGLETAVNWYQGTADAVFRNLDYIRKYSPQVVLVTSGDHIYKMDYRPMIQQHLSTGAECTVAGMRVPWEDTSRFGVMQTDAQGRVQRFLEKSPLKVSNLASMGIYCFSTDVLLNDLPKIIEQGGQDFGKDVLPAIVPRGRVMVYEFSGFWRDVGTIPSYFTTSMDALAPKTGLDLTRWRVRTNMEVRGMYLMPPARIDHRARVENAMISRGCLVQGEVYNSILSPGVRVEPGAVVRDSIIMHDTVVHSHAQINGAVIDKAVIIGSGVRIRPNYQPHDLGITVIGKEARIPEGTILKNGVVVHPETGTEAFKGHAVLEDGEDFGNHHDEKGPA